MKLQYANIPLLVLAALLILTFGCEEDFPNGQTENDPCKNMSCINGEFQADTSLCLCICDEGFFGNDCSNEDRCVTQNITCVNGGTCDQLTGECECPNGFEGDSCQTNSNLKYEGSYDVSEACTSANGDTLIVYTSSINADTGVPGRITFSNISGSGFQMKADVNENFITVPSQRLGAIHITTGSGQINETSLTINIKYNYTVSGITFSCDAIFTRQ